jgi:hypothetical protein
MHRSSYQGIGLRIGSFTMMLELHQNLFEKWARDSLALGNLVRGQWALGTSKRDQSMKGVFGSPRNHMKSPPSFKSDVASSKVLVSRPSPGAL